jgi:hypothetical protein
MSSWVTGVPLASSAGAARDARGLADAAAFCQRFKSRIRPVPKVIASSLPPAMTSPMIPTA